MCRQVSGLSSSRRYSELVAKPGAGHYAFGSDDWEALNSPRGRRHLDRPARACPAPPPLGEATTRHTRPRFPHRREQSAHLRSQSDVNALLEVPPVSDRRTSRSNVARPRHRPCADLVLDRPARREPGARQADGLGPQAAHVRPARPARREGDRGRLPLGLADGLRVRPQADRGRSDPGGHDDRRADAGAAGADRADVRGARGCTAGDHPSLQLDVDHAAARRLPAGRSRDRRSRRPGNGALQGARGEQRDGDHVRVLAGELPRHRARVRARDLRGGHGRHGSRRLRRR